MAKMKRRKILITFIFLSAFLAVASMPATLYAAQSDEPGAAEEMAREAIEQLMRAMELMIESIPQYEMPEINENGDIIIRRKHRMPHPEPGESEPDAPEIEETTI
jgi:hypothetical protein